MYGQLRALAEEAKAHGLAVVVWSYPRGSGLSKEGETAIDVTAYAAHIAAQLGAHVIKVKLPSAHVEQAAAKKVYENEGVALGTLAERVRRRPGRLRRAADRDLLGRGRRHGRSGLRAGQGDPRRRGLRLDHRAQLVPAAEARRPAVPQDGHGHLRRGQGVVLLAGEVGGAQTALALL